MTGITVSRQTPGSKAAPVHAQSMVPDVANFSFVRSEMFQGTLCDRFTKVEDVGQKRNLYTLWTTTEVRPRCGGGGGGTDRQVGIYIYLFIYLFDSSGSVSQGLIVYTCLHDGTDRDGEYSVGNSNVHGKAAHFPSGFLRFVALPLTLRNLSKGVY